VIARPSANDRDGGRQLIDIMIIEKSGHARSGLQFDDIGAARQRDTDLVWIDVLHPANDEWDTLADLFQLHPLAVEDAMRRHQRPKFDAYDGSYFLVFYGLSDEDGVIRTNELDMFIGEHFLITVHAGDIPEIGQVRRRWARPDSPVPDVSVGLLLYTILDALVDGYFPILDRIGDRVEDLEERIFESNGQAADAQREIFQAKRDLVAVRRVLGPERDVMNMLVRRDTPIFDDTTLRYMEDVYDHILRTADQADAFRDLTSNALEASLSVASNRLNQVMKRMTASSIILMSMALIAGIYGMNFSNMPELGWREGYAFALALMLAIGGGLALFFRKIDYF
jgi:magnesium transporter